MAGEYPAITDEDFELSPPIIDDLDSLLTDIISS